MTQGGEEVVASQSSGSAWARSVAELSIRANPRAPCVALLGRAWWERRGDSTGRGSTGRNVSMRMSRLRNRRRPRRSVCALA